MYEFSSNDERISISVRKRYAMLDTACNIISVHYKNIKCDISWSQDIVSMLYRWGGYFYVYVKIRKLEK